MAATTPASAGQLGLRRARIASNSTVTNATSNHPGGCNFLLLDGSVRFIKATISTDTYWSLGSKAGGEVISADSF